MKDRSVYSGVRVHRKAVGEASLNCWATSSRKGRTNEKAHRYMIFAGSTVLMRQEIMAEHLSLPRSHIHCLSLHTHAQNTLCHKELSCRLEKLPSSPEHSLNSSSYSALASKCPGWSACHSKINNDQKKMSTVCTQKRYRKKSKRKWKNEWRRPVRKLWWRNKFKETTTSLRASLVAQLVKNLLTMSETWVWSLGWEDALEEGMATHSSILTWRIPWSEEPGRL